MLSRSPVPWLVFAIAVALYTLAGLQLVPDYDIFGDARVEALMMEDNWKLVKQTFTNGPVSDPHALILSNLEYYGTAFNALAFALQKLMLPDAAVTDYAAHILKQHLVFLTSVVDVVLVALMLFVFTRNRWMLLIAIPLMALQPVYFGYAFNNIKDIPFSVTITAVSLLSALSASRIANTLKAEQGAWLKVIAYGALAGFFIGLCASIRLGGISVGVFWIAALFYCLFAARIRITWRHSFLVVSAGFACLLAAFLCIWLMHPVAWFRPFAWIWETMLYHAQHPNPVLTLTNGVLIDALDTPWYYLPEWLSAKLPVGFVVAGLIGLAALWCKLRDTNSSLLMKALIITCSLQLLWFPLIAIITSAHLYNGTRHFLMIHPALAVFAGYGCFAAYGWLKRCWHRKILLIAIALYATSLTLEMMRMHPFQVNYISEWRRVPDLHKRWSMRYEGMQAIDWMVEKELLETAPIYTNIITDHLLHGYAKGRYGKDIKFHSVSHYRLPDDKPFWFITISRRPVPDGAEAICAEKWRKTMPIGSTNVVLGGVSFCQP